LGIGAWVLLSGEKGTGGGISLPGEKEKTEEGTESLTDVLAKIKGLTSYKYDTVMSGPGFPSITSKLWRKGAKVRWESSFYEGENTVYLLDEDEQSAYVYSPARNMAEEVDFDTVKSMIDSPSLVEPFRSRAIESTEEEPVTAEEIGEFTKKEVLDGKNCWVSESSTEEEKVKIWFWIKYGIPIRMEVTTDEARW
jgi:hypothetical protein